jgi:dihydrofolate synthase / folylpolyglutamate synthase
MENVELFLDSLPRYCNNPGLFRIGNFLKKNKIKLPGFSVIIGGTNGKGSVSIMLEKALEKANLKVGVMRSPHVYRLGERIVFDGNPIDEEILAEILDFIQDHFERENENPIFADVITAAAFLYFGKYVQPEVLLLEVGIGGDLDPVNAADRDISVITNVGHDHSNVLGKYPEGIARAKAGIVKPGVPLVTGEKNPAVLEIFKEICRRENASLIFAPDAKLKEIGLGGTVSIRGKREITVAMPGLCQAGNSSIALSVIDLMKRSFSISDEAVEMGFREARLPWRMEIVRERPGIIFDGSHNLEGWRNLAQTLKYFKSSIYQVVLFIQKMKNPADFSIAFRDENVILHLPQVKEKNFHHPDEIEKALDGFRGKIIKYSSLEKATESVMEKISIGGTAVFTGSFKIAGHVKRIVEAQRAESRFRTT